MRHKGIRWHRVESDNLKEGQGTQHPGRWGIVEHQIPSIKVLFKTNTKSHKHPGIKLLSSKSKTQLVIQRKQKVAFNPGTAHSPEIQSYMMWWGAASPIHIYSVTVMTIPLSNICMTFLRDVLWSMLPTYLFPFLYILPQIFLVSCWP